MTIKRLCAIVGVVGTVAALSPRVGHAQTAAPGGTDTKAPAVTIPLKVTIVLARYKDDKRTSSLPFVLWVDTGDRASIRMNTNVPVPSPKPDANLGPGQISFQQVGTGIDCNAALVSEGLYRLELTVQDSAVEETPTQAVSATPGFPSNRNFTSTARLILRDGQTIEYATVADKVTGEVTKLDVTLNVMK